MLVDRHLSPHCESSPKVNIANVIIVIPNSRVNAATESSQFLAQSVCMLCVSPEVRVFKLKRGGIIDLAKGIVPLENRFSLLSRGLGHIHHRPRDGSDIYGGPLGSCLLYRHVFAKIQSHMHCR